MNPIEWLNQRILGFADLAPEERQAIEHFTLLWSLFEAECLNNAASSANIDDLIRQWVDGKRASLPTCRLSSVGGVMPSHER